MSNKNLEALADLASASSPEVNGRDANVADTSSENPVPTPRVSGSCNNPPTPADALAALNSLASSLNTTQQLQQLLSVAALGRNLQAPSGNLNLLGLQHQLQQSQPTQPDPSLLLSQLAHLQQLLGRTQQASVVNNGLVSSYGSVQGNHNQPEVAQDESPNRFHLVSQSAPSAQSAFSGTSSQQAMPPPLSSRPTPSGEVTLAPGSPQHRAAMLSSNDDTEVYSGDRKGHKRAANRLSAQLSRKRKKQFMEELKDENDDLKRKEQILKSIPDLIVVFDSSGKLWFVSESVSRFLQFTAKDLEGTSIWERLCEDSVRLLKAAFMDSLASRDQDSDTAPLGSGFWELRLVDRDGSQRIVTLNGVVHFTGERPECVCSIRPSDELQYSAPHATACKSDDPKHDIHYKSLIRVKPQQSVISSGSSDASSSRRKPKRGSHHGKLRDTMRISNSETSSETNSETGSGSASSDE